MNESKILNKSAYQKYLEKKKTSELMEILIQKGIRVSSNANKQKLIDQIINEPKKINDTNENEINWRSGVKVNKGGILDTLKNIIYSIILIILIQSVFIYIRFFYIIMFQGFDNYCDSDSNNNIKCIRCPANAVCHDNKMKCIENFTFLNGLCLPNCSNPEQLSSFIQLTKNELKLKAGLYKCQQAQVDWMSQDEIENILSKHYKSKQKKNFSNIFNLTIHYLMNETDIITKNISYSPVFASTDYTTPSKCYMRSVIYINTILFSIAIIINMYFYFKKRKSHYEIQAIQCLPSILRYLKSFNGSEVSERALKSLIEPMTDDTNTVWKFAANKLKSSMSVGCKKEGGERFYFYIQ